MGKAALTTLVEDQEKMAGIMTNLDAIDSDLAIANRVRVCACRDA